MKKVSQKVGDFLIINVKRTPGIFIAEIFSEEPFAVKITDDVQSHYSGLLEGDFTILEDESFLFQYDENSRDEFLVSSAREGNSPRTALRSLGFEDGKFHHVLQGDLVGVLQE